MSTDNLSGADAKAMDAVTNMMIDALRPHVPEGRSLVLAWADRTECTCDWPCGGHEAWSGTAGVGPTQKQALLAAALSSKMTTELAREHVAYQEAFDAAGLYVDAEQDDTDDDIGGVR